MKDTPQENPLIANDPEVTLMHCAALASLVGDAVEFMPEDSFTTDHAEGVNLALRCVIEALRFESTRIPEMTGPYRKEMAKAAREHIARVVGDE